MQFLFAALLAMSITMLLIPYLKRTASAFGFIDLPNERKVHSAPIPRVGGMAIGFAILVTIGLWVDFTTSVQGLMLAMTVLWLFGVFDDRYNLSSSKKFIGQIIAAYIVIFWGGVRIEQLFFGKYFLLPEWFSIIITFFTIIGATNAFNLSDGLDGLAGGSALICLGGILLLSLLGNSMQVALFCAIVIGAVFGFLRFNTYPAQIFMGDAGSQLLGFSLIIFAIQLTQDPYLPYSESLPFILLGIPVMDTLMVMASRIMRGKSPFMADRNHIHHRLLEMGLHHHEAVMVIYVMQLLMVMAAWLLRYSNDLLILSFLFAAFVAIVIGLYIARKSGFRLRNTAGVTGVPPKRYNPLLFLKQNPKAIRFTEKIIGFSIVCYIFVLIFNNSLPPTDVSILALIIGVGFLLSLGVGYRLNAYSTWFERGVFYVGALIAVSIDRSGLLSRELKFIIEFVIFLSLAISIGLRIYLSNERRFEVSPLDLLVLFVALILPNLPGTHLSVYVSGWFVFKVLLLFYAVEVLSDSQYVSRITKNSVGILFLGWLSLALLF